MRVTASMVVAVSLVLFAGSARTDPVHDPIQDFLYLGDHDQAVELPRLGGLSVLDLDVNGDGRSEVFVSADGYGGRLGNFWTIYVGGENGFERLASPSRDVMFRSDMFYVGEFEALDGRKFQGLLAYHPGEGGGDLEIYQLANGYMVKTKLSSLNLEKPDDHAFWDKYFAGPSDDQPYRSLIDHPPRHLTVKELSELGYDLSAVDRLNAIRETDPTSPKTSNTPPATPVPISTSVANAHETSPKPSQPARSASNLMSNRSSRAWIVVIIVILSAAVAVYVKRRG